MNCSNFRQYWVCAGQNLSNTIKINGGSQSYQGSGQFCLPLFLQYFALAFWRISAPPAWHTAPSPLLMTGEPCTLSCCQKPSHQSLPPHPWSPLFPHHPFFLATAGDVGLASFSSVQCQELLQSCELLLLSCKRSWHIFSAVLPIRFMGPAGAAPVLGPARLQRAVVQLSGAATSLRKPGGVVSPQPRASGQSAPWLSQLFGQLANTNSSVLPGSQASTNSKLASLWHREFSERPVVIT